MSIFEATALAQPSLESCDCCRVHGGGILPVVDSPSDEPHHGHRAWEWILPTGTPIHTHPRWTSRDGPVLAAKLVGPRPRQNSVGYQTCGFGVTIVEDEGTW